MRRFLIALTFMLLAGLGLAASASFVAAAALPTTAAYGYDREHDIDGADHTAPARGSSLQRVPVDISAGQRPVGDHGSHASVPRSAYGYDAPSTSTIPPASPRIDAPAARPGPLASSAGIRVVSGCCVATKGASGAERGGLNLFKWEDPTSTTASGWRDGDRMLTVPWKGTPKATWKENASRLRREMRSGDPIYESYVDKAGNLIPTKGFLNAERNLLSNRGWQYDPRTRSWASGR